MFPYEMEIQSDGLMGSGAASVRSARMYGNWHKDKSQVRVFFFVIITHNDKIKPHIVTKYLYEKLQLVALNYFVNFRNGLQIFILEFQTLL